MALGEPRQRGLPSGLPRRAFGPLDTRCARWRAGFSICFARARPKGRCPLGNPARGRCPLDSCEGPSALSTPVARDDGWVSPYALRVRGDWFHFPLYGVFCQEGWRDGAEFYSSGIDKARRLFRRAGGACRADGGTRTRTPCEQGILSPRCLPFHHISLYGALYHPSRRASSRPPQKQESSFFRRIP